jgi:transposase-like protein
MRRRQFGREFKIEAVRLIEDRSVTEFNETTAYRTGIAALAMRVDVDRLTAAARSFDDLLASQSRKTSIAASASSIVCILDTASNSCCALTRRARA